MPEHLAEVELAARAAPIAPPTRSTPAVVPLGGYQRLAEPLKAVVGAASAKKLATLGLETVGDLLCHYPRRYVEPNRQLPMEQLTEGAHVSVFGEVQNAEIKQNQHGGARLVVDVRDGNSLLQLTFFGKYRKSLEWRLAALQPGAKGVFSGKVGSYQNRLQLVHPVYAIFGGEGVNELDVRLDPEKLIPIYPANEKVETWQIQKAIKTVLDTLTASDVPDILSTELRTQTGITLSKLDALRLVHSPATDKDWQLAQERLRLEEAFVLQVALVQRKLQTASNAAVARPVKETNSLLSRFAALLPFELTPGQRDIGQVISGEIGSTTPMQRLLVGEVGSGKTVVALRAMLQVIDAGGQAVLLAPTEVLAQQHLRSLTALLGDLAEQSIVAPAKVRVELLTGSTPTAARRDILRDTVIGETNILVGTHALLEDNVQFHDLGLVVVDEQHRFGVEQREKLKAKGNWPHLLVMTATPIPRTIAMTIFGDLDTSELKELPRGRQQIETFVVPEYKQNWVARTWQRVAEEVAAGHRVFVVCPRIEDTETGANSKPDGISAATPPGTADNMVSAKRQLHTVAAVAEELRAIPALAGVTITELHGQMRSSDKDEIMQRFRSGEIQILVSTTVIEVGVDIPEATVMVIMDADLFGMSQLHQLRGRIGRGAHKGLCLLFSKSEPGSIGDNRVQLLASTTDGFEISNADLTLRAEGDVLGTNQAGRVSSLKLLRVTKDQDLITAARQAATELLTIDPVLSNQPDLAAAVAALDDTQKEFLAKG